MSDCKTIKCQTCGFEVVESFIEQNCPRCQNLIKSDFVCGSCNHCEGSLYKTNNPNLLNKFLLFLKDKTNFLSK